MAAILQKSLREIYSNADRCEWNLQVGGMTRRDFFVQCAAAIQQVGAQVALMQKCRPNGAKPIVLSWTAFTNFSLDESYPAGPIREIRDPGIHLALYKFTLALEQHAGIVLRFNEPRRPDPPPLLPVELVWHMTSLPVHSEYEII